MVARARVRFEFLRVPRIAVFSFVFLALCVSLNGIEAGRESVSVGSLGLAQTKSI